MDMLEVKDLSVKVEGKLSCPRSPTNQINNPRNKTRFSKFWKISTSKIIL